MEQILRRRPSPYPLNDPQKVFMAALEACEIKKGMKRSELVEKMRTCIPEYYRRRHARNENH